MINKYAIILFTLLAFFSPLSLSNPQEMWPGTVYNQEIPTIKNVLGYEIGDRISSHKDMLLYFQALAKSAPNRISIQEYGRTWENRKLIYAVIGSKHNVKNLDEFSTKMDKLSDPRITSKAEAKKIAQSLASSVWLAYGVHGNEISSTDAAMMTAYHLLAAVDDERVKKILNNTLVFIDPLQNPDGRTRFVSRYYETVGLVDNGDRLNAEHNEPWPQGRSNHYLFDMNRDWLALTQPETKGRVKVLNKFHPLVVIDLHEMGGDSGYYFAPPAKPINPHMTDMQIKNITKVGFNNAKHFDQFGFDYFTREVFDAFYPGYGDSWPTFYGAAASTYEVGSSRGESFRMKSGEYLSYKLTVQKHFVASISTAEVVAENRQEFLDNYYDYQVSAINQGQTNKQRIFILPNTRDLAGNHRLVSLLDEHGVEIQQADDKFNACGKSYKKGAFIIDSAQPRGQFIQTVMSKQVDMDSKFLKEQERRRSDKLDTEIYDVTAWSLPLMFNIDTDTCGKAIKVNSQKFGSNQQLQATISNPNPTVAYLVPWGDMAAGRFLTMALRKGLKIKSANKTFTLENKNQYPAGTLIIEVKSNEEDLASQVQYIANETGAIVDGVNSSWVIQGPSFGSDETIQMTVPNIAMAWDEPTDSLSAGNTRFVIERQFNYPVTAIRTSTLSKADLSFYHVLILPTGDYKDYFNKKGIKNLKNWISQGGVLITLGTATRFVADAEVGLLSVKRELAFKDKDQKNENSPVQDETKKNSKKSTVASQLINTKNELLSAIENDDERPANVPGVLVNVEVDKNHWLAAGINKQLIAMVTGRDIYTPIKLKYGKNIAWFTEKEKLLASGYLWEESKTQLPFKPYLIHQPLGAGMIISFTQEPTYRAYLDGLNVLFLNTIFRAAAHSGQLK
jgi:hypothetical protein